MTLFESNDKLYHLVEANYNLLPVMNRFGIRPGFKDKTVAEACADKNINKDFFLALINTYNSPEFFPETELLSFSPVLIVEYLNKTHNYYREYFIPKLERLLEKLISGSPGGNNDLKMIRTFYEKYKKKFLLHLRNEEEHVFPFVIKMVENPDGLAGKPLPFSIENEHSNMETELNDLKNLLIKYLAPAYNDNDFNEFLSALYQFEKDMADHSRIEDKILVTQMLEISKSN